MRITTKTMHDIKITIEEDNIALRNTAEIVWACLKFELKSVTERVIFEIENGGLLYRSVYLVSFMFDRKRK